MEKKIRKEVRIYGNNKQQKRKKKAQTREEEQEGKELRRKMLK